ncbi:serine/arginine repetitive matrix protein 1-like [Quercus lobata]|uniref:serine/arginine repetitive matrix protein 1-like n=1 Tax=Quercus lobata TaxID=97700 RepID=UPI00124471A6|nr:serine/arginine repetitive matrix protein 1-like [Quercus lobata]
MSRCYPYPPPGFVRNEAVLIESIKLQNKTEKDKTESKKEKKREKKEKKEKRKARKENEKLSDIGDVKTTIKLNDKKYDQSVQSKAESCGGNLQKRIEDETEQLERSGLTEEHGQAVCSPNVSYLSDSTQKSNKRKRETSPSSDISSHGTILRLRLPLKKHKELDASRSNKQLCSTSGRVDSPAQQKNGSTLAQQKNGIVDVRSQEKDRSINSTKNILAKELTHGPKKVVPGPVLRKIETTPNPEKVVPGPVPMKIETKPKPEKVLPRKIETTPNPEKVVPGPVPKKIETKPKPEKVVPRKIETTAGPVPMKIERTPNPEKVVPAPVPMKIERTPNPEKEVPCTVPRRTELTSHEKKIQRKESAYKTLFENWVLPPPHYQGDDFGDEDWLLGKKQADTNGSKRLKAGNDVSSCRCPTSWPHAHYLPEAEIHALPYTIPF